MEPHNYNWRFGSDEFPCHFGVVFRFQPVVFGGGTGHPMFLVQCYFQGGYHENLGVLPFLFFLLRKV